jgi:hypothetical protein
LKKLSYLIQTLPKTPETFFPFSLVVFAPYAKFLRRFSQNNAEIGLCLDEKKACCAFVHMSSKSCPKLYFIAMLLLNMSVTT